MSVAMVAVDETVADVLRDALEDRRGLTLRATVRGARLEYGAREVWQRLRESALGLHTAGIGRGDRVLVEGVGHPEVALATLGALMVGSTVTLAPSDPLAATLGRFARTDAVIARSGRLPRRLEEIGVEPRVAVIVEPSQVRPPALALDRIGARGLVREACEPAILGRLTSRVHAEDPLLATFTAGALGRASRALAGLGNAGRGPSARWLVSLRPQEPLQLVAAIAAFASDGVLCLPRDDGNGLPTDIVTHEPDVLVVDGDGAERVVEFASGDRERLGWWGSHRVRRALGGRLTTLVCIDELSPRLRQRLDELTIDLVELDRS